MYLHHPASDAQNHQCFYFCGAGRTCVCTPACGLTVWWIVQGSGETLGEDSNTHTHSLTHTHTHTHHHHQTRTHTQHTLGGRRRTKVSGASSSLISALLSVRGRRQKKFPIGEEEERKRRGVSTHRAALRFCFWFWTLFFYFLIFYACVGITRGAAPGDPFLLCGLSFCTDRQPAGVVLTNSPQ